MRAIGYFVLIRQTQEEVRETSSGFQMATKEDKDLRYINGEVISVGSEIGDALKAGEKIKFDKVAGHEVLINEEKLKLIKIQDVAMVL